MNSPTTKGLIQRGTPVSGALRYMSDLVTALECEGIPVQLSGGVDLASPYSAAVAVDVPADALAVVESLMDEDSRLNQWKRDDSQTCPAWVIGGGTVVLRVGWSL